MNITPTTQKKIDDRDRLVKKHEREIEEQKDIISNLEKEIEKLEHDMKKDFEDIYNSANYRRIWNDFKVNKSIAEKKIYFDNYQNPIKYKNNLISSANNLLKQATEKRDKRITQILNMLPKKTKSANFRQITQKKSNNSKSSSKNKLSKGGRKKTKHRKKRRGRKRKKTKRNC